MNRLDNIEKMFYGGLAFDKYLCWDLKSSVSIGSDAFTDSEGAWYCAPTSQPTATPAPTPLPTLNPWTLVSSSSALTFTGFDGPEEFTTSHATAFAAALVNSTDTLLHTSQIHSVSAVNHVTVTVTQRRLLSRY